MNLIETLRGIGKAGARRVLHDEIRQYSDSLDLMHERFAELELALEDQDWMRLMGEDSSEFSRAGLRKISRLAKLMIVKNPIIQRGVNVKMAYVWGQGMSWKAADEDIQQAIKAFIDDDYNKAELTSHQARMMKEKELEADGNIFFVFFTNISTGHVRVRSLPFDEIEEIICSPGDKKEPWFYLRQWQQVRVNFSTGEKQTVQRKAYYPDWRYMPVKKQTSIGNIPIHWSEPVYHLKVGGFSDWKFGLSEVYAGIDWARAYKEFLEDVATLMRAYSRFAWKLATKGGKRGIAQAKSTLATTLGSGGDSVETNPSPLVGSTFISGGTAELTPYNVRGASVNPEDGRRIFLMAAAALGLPETFFGDVSVGTLATAESLDRPTELMMLDRQTLWKDVHMAIFEYVLRQAIKAPSGMLGAKHGNVLQRREKDQITERIEWRDAMDSLVDIDFPPIIEDDIEKTINAIVKAATLNGQELAGTLDIETVTRMLLITLGEDDVDEVMEKLFPEDGSRLTPDEEAFLGSVNKLRARLEESLDEVKR